jgi:hypothetical protein
MANREAAAASERPLPPLPEPDGYAAMTAQGTIIVSPREYEKHNAYAVFSAAQLRAYVLADRAASAPQEVDELIERITPENRHPAMLEDAPQAVRMPLTEADLDWGMDCNIEDPSDEEAHAFECGVRFAEWKHGIVPLSPQDTPKEGGSQ